MRKLDLNFLADMTKTTGAVSAAYLYEEIASNAVVDATARDGKFSLFDIALQMGVGWLPFVLASMNGGGPFWASFAGAVAFNRIDNIVYALGGRPLTHTGVALPGETMAEVTARVGAGTIQ